jgi:hypothetical protein
LKPSQELIRGINLLPDDSSSAAKMTCSPFFIVGHERSGTTLLAAGLDRHSRVAVPPETHFFADLCPAVHAGLSADPAVMVNHFFKGFRIRDLKLDPGELLGRLTDVQPTWTNLFLEALKLYAQRHGKQFVGEKTPGHWRDVPQILKLLPRSRIIWVVRDGRDTVLSLMKTPWKQHSNPALHALRWRYTTDRMLAFESQFPDRILRVKYEHLVRNVEAELRRACEFLGVEFEPGQLDLSVKSEVVPAWEMSWKGRVFTPPDPSRIGNALRELPQRLLQLLNFLMEPSMRRLGYDVGPP